MPYTSRKRKAANGAPSAKRRKMTIPARGKGYMRTGGFYGRYANGGELKFHDLDIDDAIIDNAGTVTNSVNLIPQGVEEKERIGRKCTLKHLSWKYDIDLPVRDAVGVPSNGDVVRVIVFVDKQANGATAVTTDILETAQYQSFYNLANQNRFRILCDKTTAINYDSLASDGAGVVSQAEVTRSYTFNKTLNLPIEFSSTTGAITEIRSNNIGVLLLSRSAFAGFNSTMRIRFSDS